MKKTLIGCYWILVSLTSVIAQDKDLPGNPGLPVVPDLYNSFGIPWNRTYSPTEPQQIHLSITNQGEIAKVQFTTLQPTQTTLLKYWIKGNCSNPSSKTDSQDWVFVDGGNAKRSIYLHNIQTQPLEINTVYQYQVGSISGKNNKTLWSPKFEFHTPSPQPTFKFLATGDLGVNNAVAMIEIFKRVKTHQYDFFTLAGDQAYDFHDFDGTKGDQYMNFVQPLFANIPFQVVAGNHETMYNYSHYRNRFNNVPYQESNSNDPLLYSFNYKSLHLVSFSSEFYYEAGANTTKTDQAKYAIDWLEADLARANQERDQQPWIIFMTHRPFYCTANSPSCYSPNMIMRNELESILLKYKVDVNMAGHVHNYERTYPMKNATIQGTSYHNAPSFFQLVIGNTGQPEGPSLFIPGTIPAWSATRYSGYGFSEFIVSPDRLEMTHLAVNMDGSLGKIIDHIVVTKSS